MAEKESTKSVRLPTGMVKRANPLSLNTQESKPAKQKKAPTVSKIKTDHPVQLSGPKQWVFFVPRLNQALMSAIKQAFPNAAKATLIEKALLLLLKEERPNAYDQLVKDVKK